MQIVRESIFVSAIRAFINAFFAVIGVLIGLLILVSVLASFGKSSKPPFAHLELEILPDHNGGVTPLGESAPVILNIDIEGVIGMDSLTSEIVENILFASRQGLLKNDRVKGILLKINSPGGVAIDSADIYHSLMEYKKRFNIPIFAHVNGFCASGSYFIACAADTIEATPLSVIGSVGVRFGPNFNFYEMMQKHGVQEKTFTAGKYKVKWPMFEKLPPENAGETSYSDLEKTIQETYQIFLDVVDSARSKYGLTKTLLLNEYGAQVYISSDALSKGYINKDNTYYYETLEQLLKATNLEDTHYQLYRFYYKPPFIESLVRGEFMSLLLSPKKLIKKLTTKEPPKVEFLYDGA